MTWSMAASGSELFEPIARRRSDIFDRDPFDDDEEENLENGEFDDEDELDEDEEEDEDEFEDDDYDDDDDLEEDEEEEDDL
ncbi:MAG TPA: hypothetical protein VL503_07625 [Candidatus Omnitrophota bacterium]|jgi:hypothetical protein|nr:hypothetical protein [Candidatus Eisenbacteria bacterium]HTM00977.1 hypothetical protein [Candidatus Omnitrophota bacterium]